jgi:hypothetical protein
VCDFLSACVLRNGDVLTHPLLDSHSDLVRYYELPDTRAYHQHFAKVELTPGDWLQPETWNFRLDEDTAPGWWDEVKTQAEATLRDRAREMLITTGRKALILEGCWILAGDATVGELRGGRIINMFGGTVQAISGGTVQAIYGGTVQAIYGGTVQTIYGGTVQAIRGGTVQTIYGGTVQAIRGGTVPKPGPYATLSKQALEFLKAQEPKPTRARKTVNKKSAPARKRAK